VAGGVTFSSEGDRFAYAVPDSARPGFAVYIYSITTRRSQLLRRFEGEDVFAVDVTDWSTEGQIYGDLGRALPDTTFSNTVFRIDVGSAAIDTVPLPIGEGRMGIFPRLLPSGVGLLYLEEAALRSPDGRWMVYMSNQTGSRALYIRRYPELTDQTKIAEVPNISWVGGATWGADSRSVSFLAADGIYTAVLDFSDGVRVASVSNILPHSPGLAVSVGDRHPDGDRFLRFRPVSIEASPRRLMMMTNWFTELREAFREGN